MPNQVLKGSQLFNLLQIYPEITNISIAKVPEKSEELEILEQMQFTTWDQFSHDTFHPTKSMPFLTQFFLAVTLLVILVGISKCFCRFCNCCQQDSYRIPFVDNTIQRPTAMQNFRNRWSTLKHNLLASCNSCNKQTEQEPSAPIEDIDLERQEPITKQVKFRTPMDDSYPEISKSQEKLQSILKI